MTSEQSAGKQKRPLFQAQVLDRQRRFRIFPKAVASFCNAILQALRQSPSALTVIFVGSRKMRALNRMYRGRDHPTDVLSFNYGDETVEGVPFLGEIVISPGVAYNHARRHGTDPERELRLLILHGMLHLAGYDHETDRGEMKSLETQLRRRRFFQETAPVADMRAR